MTTVNSISSCQEYRKEYRILASQDNYIFVMNKCSKFYTNTIVMPPQEHVNMFSKHFKTIREKPILTKINNMVGYSHVMDVFRWFQPVSG